MNRLFKILKLHTSWKLICSLAFFVCFMVGAYTAFKLTTSPLNTDRAALNTTTRQRILVQKLVDDAFQVVTFPRSDPKRKQGHQCLVRSVSELKKLHTPDLYKNTILTEEEIHFSAYDKEAAAINHAMPKFLLLAQSLLKAPEDIKRQSKAFLKLEDLSREHLIPALETSMQLIDERIRLRVAKIENVAGIVLISVFCLLGIIVVLVLKPFVKRAKQDEDTEKKLVESGRALSASRKALSDQVRLSESILNGVGDGVIVSDNAGKIVLLNPSGARILGEVMSELPTKETLAHLHRNYEICNATSLKRFSTEELPLHRALRGERTQLEAFIRKPKMGIKDGIFLMATGTPIRDERNQVHGAMVVFRDITKEKAAFAAIQASERRYHTLLESANEIFYEVNTEGTILSVNNTFEELTGFDRREWIGRSFEGLIHPQDIDKTKAQFEKGIAGTGGDEIEFRVLSKDGSYLCFSAAPGKQLVEDGRLVGLWGFARDITAKKETEEQLRQSQELILKAFKAIPLPMGIATLDGTFIEVNQHLAALVGLPKAKLIGKKSFDLGIWSAPGERARMIETIQRCGSANRIELTVSSRGKSLDMLGDFELVRLRGKQCVLGLLIDITETKSTQKRLEEAKEASDSANRAKSAFLANISHEIRTPLSAISGYLEMLDGEYREHLNHSPKNTVMSYMSRIQYNIKSVIQLIDDLLDISKVEAGMFDIDKLPFALMEELGELLLFLREQANNKGLEFRLSFDSALPERAHTDPMRLRQLVLNVVGNAIKFTDKGFVEVRLFLKKINGEELFCIRISDSGCGIAKDQQSNLYKPFVQADSSMTRRYGGTGLGLSLSRRLARKMGGDLILEDSSPDRGSTFLITIHPGSLEGVRRLEDLSIEDLEVWKARPQKKEVISLEGIRVLLVEDGPDNRRVISHFLRGAGASVEMAHNGKQGLKFATTRDYDIILMDIQMPIMGGYEATENLRARGFKTPIIALTAAAMKAEREQCLKSGCDGYLTKPFEVNALLRLVHCYGKKESLIKKQSPNLAKRVIMSTPLYSLYKEDPRVAPIVNGFVKRLPQRVGSLKEAFTNQDWHTLKSLAHQLKGAAGGYGYPDLTDVARKIELAAESKNPREAESYINAFNEYSKRAELGIRS